MDEAIHLGKVDAALAALRKCAATRTIDGKPHTQLFEETTNILYLHVSLKKVPVSLADVRTIRISLPNPYISMKTTSICLFVKDIDSDKWGPDVDKSARYYKEQLMWEKNVRCFQEVIALRQLKREYKTYEAKRKLCSAYDIFFADGAIQPLIMRNLGKAFFKAKKLPLSLDLSKKNIEKQVQAAVESTRMMVKPTSTRCTLKFGSLEQTNDHLMENLARIMEEFKTKLPGGVPNIRSLHIATQTSPPLTFYVSTSNAAFVTLPAPQKRKAKPVVGELSTIDSDAEDSEGLDDDVGIARGKKNISSQVRVYPDGRVRHLDRRGVEMESQFERRAKGSLNVRDMSKTNTRRRAPKRVNRRRGVSMVTAK